MKYITSELREMGAFRTSKGREKLKNASGNIKNV